MFKEIDGLIFSETSAIKKPDTGGNSSSRKSTTRKENSKSIDKSSPVKLRTSKMKKIPDFPLDQKPY